MIIQCWSGITRRFICLINIWFMNSKKMFVLLAFHIDILPRFRCLKPRACTLYSGYSSASPCSQPQPIHIVLFPMQCRCIEQWWKFGTKVRGGLCLGVKCQMFAAWATVPWVVRHLKASLDAKCWMFDALVGAEQAHTSGWRSLTVQAKPAAHPPAEARQCIYSKHRIPPSVLLQRDCKQLWIWIL